MADENLQPACNVPKLYIWPQHVAQREKQHQLSKNQTQQSTLESNIFDEADQPDINTLERLDDLTHDRTNEDTLADDLETRKELKEVQLSVALIEEVRRYPCVWNVTLNSNKDKPKKMEAWRRISASLNQPESVLTKEFDRLKDNYRRCIRKREKMTRSGCAGTKLPTCEYFAELSFLRDIVTGRKTETNISKETSTSEWAVSSMPSSTNTITISDMSNSTQPNSTTGDPKSIRNARKRRSDQIDELLAISLSNDLKNEKKETTKKEENGDVLFCSSLIESFQKLKGRKNKQAKVKVLQVLLEFEENEDDNI